MIGSSNSPTKNRCATVAVTPCYIIDSGSYTGTSPAAYEGIVGIIYKKDFDWSLYNYIIINKGGYSNSTGGYFSKAVYSIKDNGVVAGWRMYDSETLSELRGTMISSDLGDVNYYIVFKDDRIDFKAEASGKKRDLQRGWISQVTFI